MGYTANGGFYMGGVRLKRLPRASGSHDAIATSFYTDRPLLIIGPVGTGKTTLMAEVDLWTENVRNSIRALDAERFPRFVSPPSFRYNLWTSANEYCDDVKAGFSDASLSCAKAVDARRLFLDDLGVERDTPHNSDAITTLIDGRYVRELPTWITTNLSLLELRQRYGERIFSRIFDRALLVQLEGDDMRLLAPEPQLSERSV